MSRILTGDKLVESIRNRAMIPDDTDTYTDQDLLEICNEELDVQLLDKLIEIQGENLTVSYDEPRNEKGVYEMPYRAVGNKLRDVAMIRGKEVYELTQISIGALSDYSFETDGYSDLLDKFYVENNQIKLVAPRSGYDSIRFYYYMRPSVITKLDQAAVITNITKDEVNDEVTLTCSNVPNDFNTQTLYDIVATRTPNKIKKIDIPLKEVNASLNFIKFNLSDVQDILSSLIVGDYVCKAEESPVPNIPTEMHPVLAQLAAIHYLEAVNDTEGLKNAMTRFDRMFKSVQTLIDDRVDFAQKKIKPRNGTLREGRMSQYRRRRGR